MGQGEVGGCHPKSESALQMAVERLWSMPLFKYLGLGNAPFTLGGSVSDILGSWSVTVLGSCCSLM